MLSTTSGDWGRWHLAAPRGLNQSFPFRDPRLVCFTLALPRHVRGVPGMVKPLLQTAMRGVLPEEIRLKRCTPGFDDAHGLGLRRNMPHLERLARHTSFGELGIVDPEKLIPALHQAALGIGDAQATDRLDKTLSLIAWFDQVVRRRPAGEPVVVHHLDGQPDSNQRHLVPNGASSIFDGEGNKPSLGGA
jgi:asparagine synthase (glutamine-hydrolysing)